MNLQKYFGKGLENRIYKEKTFLGTDEEYLDLLKKSNTIYVSGVNTKIKEERLWHLFSIVGTIRRIIMGINKAKLEFCGFLFVEYENPEDAEEAILFFKDFVLDSNVLRVDKDMGFTQGRQFGRGVFGGPMKQDKKRRYIR